MFRRFSAALAATLLIVGLVAPASALAGGGITPSCVNDSVSVDEDGTISNGQVTCSDVDAGTADYELASPVVHGTLNLNTSDGSFSYSPDPDYFGSDPFDFTVTDGDGTSPVKTISITVDPVNDAPTFTKGSDQTVNEDPGQKTVSGWVAAVDAGPSNENSQTFTYPISNDNIGLFSSQPVVAPNGTLTFTPAPNANGSATVTLHVQDSGGTANGGDNSSASQTFDITVSAVNDPPTFTKGADQSVSENAGLQTVTGWATNILEGPANESGQTVSFSVSNDNNPLFSTQPAISSNGTLTYRPATSASGSATVSVTLGDNGGTANGGDNTSTIATFTIDVGSVNDPPSFTEGADQGVFEDAGAQSVAAWAKNISPGPSDESGQSITFVIDSNSNTALFSAGPAVSGTTGNLTYTTAANANGSATIVLHARDNGTPHSDSATATLVITVTAVNDPPTFSKGGNQAVLSNSGARTVAGWASSILEGPSNESSQTVAFTVTNDNNALFSVQPAISPTGTLTYTPAPSQDGVAVVSVQLVDNGSNVSPNDNSSAIVTFTISVTGINDPPSFTKGAGVVVLEDPGAQTVSGWATAIGKGPPDESGQTVTFVASNDNNPLFSSQPAVNGSTGNLTFTPALNAVGTATVTIYARDNGGVANGGNDTSPSQSFTITVNAVNDPPSFVKGSDQAVLEDAVVAPVVGWATALSKGPVDEAGQTLTFDVVSNTKPALFLIPPAVSATGALSYTLAANANGTATIGIELHDNGATANGGDDTSTIQTFKIVVTPVNDAPTCVNATAATFVGSPLNGTFTTCTDIDGDSLKYVSVTDPTHGTVTVSPTASTFTYAPATAFQGTDSFTFQANDGHTPLNLSNIVTMSILVSPDPIAKNDVAPTDFPALQQGSGATAIPVLANDIDKQGGPLKIVSTTQGTKGKVVMLPGGTGLTYDPTAFATGTDSFRYTIEDNQQRQNSATVVVVISPATPIGARPTATIVSPSTLGSTTGKVRITWTNLDDGTGLKSYQLQESFNSGAFKTVSLSTAKSTSALRSFTFGKPYKYRLKVTDTAGNVSPWAISATFVVSRVQEDTVGVAYSGPWVAAASTTYSGGKARYANAAAASVTYSLSGEGVAWVSSKGPTRGSAQVLIDGVLVKSVSLFTSTTTAQQVVFSTAWPTMGLHTIKIVVLGTAGHPRVDLDTFVIAK